MTYIRDPYYPNFWDSDGEYDKPGFKAADGTIFQCATEADLLRGVQPRRIQTRSFMFRCTVRVYQGETASQLRESGNRLHPADVSGCERGCTVVNATLIHRGAEMDCNGICCKPTHPEVPVHPVQSRGPIHHSAMCPQVVTLRAYEVYCEVFSPQDALVTGGCRGGFGVGELIAFLYARSFPRTEWKDRVDEAFLGMRQL